MWIDITWLLIAIAGLWRGWQKGLIISIFTSLAWVLGFIGALKLSSVAAVALRDKFNWQTEYLPVVSFILVFIIIAFAVFIIGKTLEKMVEVIQLGFINRALGALLKVIIFTVMFSLFIWFINQAGFVSPEVKTQSKSFNSLLPLADHTIEFFEQNIPAIKAVFTDIENFFATLAKQPAA